MAGLVTIWLAGQNRISYSWEIQELVSFQWNRRFFRSMCPEVGTSYAKMQVAPSKVEDVDAKLPNVALAVMVLG